MRKIVTLVILTFMSSCVEKNHQEISSKQNQNKLDTLRFLENMRFDSRLDFEWDKYTPDSLIPRETWVKVDVKGIKELINILKHSNLFLVSKDSLLEVQKVTNNQFRIKVNKDYSGFRPSHGGECLTIESIIQPKEGYLFEFYWLKKGIIYPSSTNLMLHYLPIEEN
jgi:hypothetical protein